MAEYNYPALDRDAVAKAIEKNPFASVGNVVFDVLEKAILESRLMPGEKLIISHLANELTVSTTPVREAIDRLAQSGLVEVSTKEDGKHKNYYVFKLSTDELEDLFVARKAIETTATQVCAEKPWRVDLNQLQELATDFQNTLENEVKYRTPTAKQDMAELDRKFHSLLVESTGNKHLIESYRTIEKKINYLSIRTCSILAKESYERLLALGAQHQSIVNAIQLGFGELAAKLMNEHLDYCMNSCLKNKNR